MSTLNLWHSALVLAAALSLVSCATNPDAGLPPDDSSHPEEPRASIVAEGLDAPWSITFHGETPLVSERDSTRVLELDHQGAAREVAVISDARPSGEGGLLGLAEYKDHLYVYFTSTQDNRIARYALSGEPGSLTLGSPEVILEGIPASSNHNGGRLAFGPDGMLYATVGDAGDRPRAQDLESLSGKILRMTPDGTVPSDNPFAGSYIYSYGHRNPQGIAWDDDDNMYASEFGQNEWDELNVITAGSNYGWPEVEGIASQDRYIDPVQQWNPANASPSGIAIAGGSIWIANLRGERLREVPLDDLTASTEHWREEQGRLRDVVVAPDGAPWVLTNNTDGRGEPRPGDDRVLRFGLLR